MKHQGKQHPPNVATFRDRMVDLGIPTVLVAMATKQWFVRPLHSFFRFMLKRNDNTEYDKKLLAAIGDRDGNDDPSFHQVQATLFDWRQIKLVKDKTDGGKLFKYFEDPAKQVTFFKPVAGVVEMDCNGTYIPKLALVPAEVALKTVRKKMTA